MVPPASDEEELADDEAAQHTSNAAELGRMLFKNSYAELASCALHRVGEVFDLLLWATACGNFAGNAKRQEDVGCFVDSAGSEILWDIEAASRRAARSFVGCPLGRFCLGASGSSTACSRWLGS